MTPLSLSPDQHRALWHKIALIREATRDLRSTSEASRVIGLGSLFRSIEDASALTGSAVSDIAAILESAAQQTEQRV